MSNVVAFKQRDRSIAELAYEHISWAMKIGDLFTSQDIARVVGCSNAQASASLFRFESLGMIKRVARNNKFVVWEFVGIEHDVRFTRPPKKPVTRNRIAGSSRRDDYFNLPQLGEPKPHPKVDERKRKEKLDDLVVLMLDIDKRMAALKEQLIERLTTIKPLKSYTDEELWSELIRREQERKGN